MVLNALLSLFIEVSQVWARGFNPATGRRAAIQIEKETQEAI
jgi:hypothetical protein